MQDKENSYWPRRNILRITVDRPPISFLGRTNNVSNEGLALKVPADISLSRWKGKHFAAHLPPPNQQTYWKIRWDKWLSEYACLLFFSAVKQNAEEALSVPCDEGLHHFSPVWASSYFRLLSLVQEPSTGPQDNFSSFFFSLLFLRCFYRHELWQANPQDSKKCIENFQTRGAFLRCHFGCIKFKNGPGDDIT